MAKPRTDVLQGTLDLLILKILERTPMHGYGIASSIERISDELLRVEEGSLYPALYKLEENGLITADWGITENNRKAKYYQLTAQGRKQLRLQTERWTEYAGAVFKVLRTA